DLGHLFFHYYLIIAFRVNQPQLEDLA
ncbi:MAG: hypothetical protein RL270_448, partial [Actinomycetota bacterium]